MYRVALLLPVLLLLQLPSSVAPALAVHELSFLVLSQPARFNAARARHLKRSIVEQIRELDQDIAPSRPDNVFLTHELFPEQEGAWAITPILGHIRASILRSTHRTARWLIVCEEQSHVNVSLLAHHLANEDYREKLFLGYPLYDREATIIHHFAFFKNPSSFLYPYLRAGIALTVPLVDHLVQLLSDGAARPALSDFFIDAAHEFALAVWQHGQGFPLQPRRYFCAKALPNCAIHGAGPYASGTGNDILVGNDGHSCTNNPTDVDQIMFAVKTCGKYHKDRVTALKNTWTKYVQHLRYFSDVDDPSIPTVATSVPNSSAGHCAKTLEILQLIGDEIRYNGSLQAVRWVMLVDDDTILSSASLARFLSCYDANRDLYLGERYGYHLMGPDGGYNYVTGGGGIVLSVAILDALQQTCECPSASSPDDMILAACLQRLGIRPIHSNLFHQARPSDYAPELLDRQDTVSFHKHWQIDPQQVYNRWFRQQDVDYFERQQIRSYWSRPAPVSEAICKHSNSVHSPEAGANLRHKDHQLDPCLRPTRPNVSVRNEHTKVREHRLGPTDEGENKRSPQQSNHNDRHQHPERVLRLVTKATEPNAPTNERSVRVTSTVHPLTTVQPHSPQQHIARKHLCESNELQSNGNLLLRRQNLQESTNIIKHTDL
ncbi:beta-1,3-glucosyltransferase [Anopheles funestus]|uniref:beta-1,3-glucosyltransferase n=1 Tax=Anopheles funestus TaxID=62324 RepID=UPI0020C6C2B0|nr:beta-1,3-glucosyltransferase [Anopheles funestus]XP_049288709.1 beta-1,3-glucosyltransferase [Anopheles funestus]XP_049288710.1 beta-1,3-glucosyltransferase [Anopheles funestus]XP_049288711.1 beta-1,3-glucosyltransferase [Anopheles funestus]